MSDANFKSFDIPYLPSSASELPTPKGFLFELFPHQKRALHRLVSIESDQAASTNSFRSGAFGTHLDYTAKGGVLADRVGMGKTATILALICSEPRNSSFGPNLLLCPPHLMRQWSQEVLKFCPTEINVFIGLPEYQEAICKRPLSLDNRTLVIVDALSVFQSPRVYYKHRNLYEKWKPLKKVKCYDKVFVTDQTIKNMYIQKAIWISPGFEGVLYGTGGDAQHALFFPNSVLGNFRSGFRRVIFDEIQDYIEDGKQEKDCLLQLTQYTNNVWLVSATPFPAGAKSVYANHQLLGFRRLRIFCESINPLPPHCPFEILKRKLYIRSSAEEHDNIINPKYEVQLIEFSLSKIELEMYRALHRKAVVTSLDEADSAAGNFDVNENKIDADYWDEHYTSLRTAVTFFGASESIRNEIRCQGGRSSKFLDLLTLFRSLVPSRRVFASNEFVEYSHLKSSEIPSVENAVKFADHFWHTYGQMDSDSDLLRVPESDVKQALQGVRSIQVESTERKVNKKYKLVTSYAEILGFSMNVVQKRSLLQLYRKDMKNLLEQFQRKSSQKKMESKIMISEISRISILLNDTLETAQVPRYGTKISKLMDLIGKIPEQHQILVFAYDKNVVDFINGIFIKTPNLQSTVSLFGSVRERSSAVEKFRCGYARILLACFRDSASGSNLQNARHVIFMDIPGTSKEQGASLIIQAMGRVIRLGQENQVKVYYLIARETHEMKLMKSVIQELHLYKTMTDKSYVCEERPLNIFQSVRNEKLSESKDFEVVKQISLDEKLRESLKRAKEKGLVIELDDDEHICHNIKEQECNNSLGKSTKRGGVSFKSSAAPFNAPITSSDSASQVIYNTPKRLKL